MGYKVPIVHEYCLCCDLKTGTIILGVLNLIAAVLATLISLALLVSTEVLVRAGDVISIQQNGEAVVAWDKEMLDYLCFGESLLAMFETELLFLA